MKRLLLHTCFALENFHLLAGGYYNTVLILRARPGTTPDSATVASTNTSASNRQS